MSREQEFSLIHLSRPPEQPSEGKAPCVLLLHGVGANEQDLFGLAPYLDPRFHILSVRAPIEMGPHMYGWYWIQVLPGGQFHYDEEEALASLARIGEFIAEAKAAYNVDPERFYLVGFSQGAIQSCATLLMHPDTISGVVAMSGRWPEPAEARRAPDAQLAGKPLLAIHGLYDPVIPIAYGRKLKEKFAALPVDLTYEEFPIGHSTSLESVQLVSQWLTAQLER